MRISDWSSDVCSSDLSFLGPTRKEVSQYPRRCLRLLIEKEMPARHGRGADIRAALAPFRRNVEQGRHDAVLRPQSQQRTCHLGYVVGRVMLEVDRRSRAVIRADRQMVVWGRSVSVRVDIGGGRLRKKKNNR